MDTRYLSYIIEIAHEKNMRKAAEKLYVSQPSLSQYLTKLEMELGTPLFIRAKGQLILTRAGKMYVDCAQKMIDMKKELYQDIAELTNSGHINIATTSIWALKMVSEFVPRLKKEFPEINLELFEGNLVPTEKLLEERSIDIAFVATNSIQKFSGCSEFLGYEEILLAVPSSHPFCSSHAEKKEITADELSAAFQNDSFILPRKESSVNRAIDPFLKECSIDMDGICIVNHMTTVSNMVANQVGIAFIPHTCIRPDAPIVYYSLSPKVFRLAAVLYRNDRPLTKAENRLIQMAKDYPLFRTS
ncbi:MAG: LysR family transcriptional regulator [Lachnospiraceae bacterium]